MAARTGEARAAASDLELVATRELDAPRELVWAAWTEPARIARWWGPRGFTNTIEEMDVRPGGAWRLVMHGPDGTDDRNEHRYLEVVRPERIVMDHVSGHRFRMTATFEERGARTLVTMRMTFPSAEERDRVVTQHVDEGLRQTVERLGEYVASATGGAAAPDPAREIVLSRSFDAPRELVFAAWTDPAHLPRWWGPKGFTNTTRTIDVRPGGTWRFDMHGPDGAVFANRVVFEEIARPERLRLAVDSGEDGDPERFHAIVTFEEVAGGTRLTLRSIFPTAEQRERVVGLGAIEQAKTSLEKLAEHLDGADAPRRTAFLVPPGEPVFYGRRILDAPRELVWEAVTRPEHLARWYGPRRSTVGRCEVDLRPGGAWRIEVRTPDGSVHGFGGVHREVLPKERIVRTWRWDGAPGAESLETMTLAERGGRTVLTMKAVHASVANRDAHVRNGMEEGAAETMDRLAELLAELGTARR